MQNKQNPENPENNIQEHYAKFREAIDQVIEERKAREIASKKAFKESLVEFMAAGPSKTDSKFFIEGVE